MDSLTIVHVDSPDDSVEQLADTVSSLGYTPSIRDAVSWAKDGENDETLILFVNSESDCWKHLLNRFSRQPHPFSLGIFCRDLVSSHHDLLQHCVDFISWPARQGELRARLCRLNSQKGLGRKNSTPFYGLPHTNLVGRAPIFRDTLRLIQKVAPCDVPTLIEGETGTGKELAARALHDLSERKHHPFIPVNCGSLTDSLLENELFGHVKGAYTDAKQTQQGLVAQAQGGTLFLDEVDSLSPSAQVSLLRFLQDKKYRPLGGGTPQDADVRIITASNRYLDELVKRDRFRQDLLFRLNVVKLTMPSLRDRPGDARMIAEHFLTLYRERYQVPDKRLHPAFLRWLECYEWPGNVRELENLVHRQFLLSEGPIMYPPTTQNCKISDSQPDDNIDTLSEAKAHVIEKFEKRYLTHILEKSSGNVTLAARMAGKERRAFGKLLKKYDIDRTLYLEPTD